MKKSAEKKLTLSKIKIANLNNMNRQENMAKPTYTGCSLFRCTPPPTAH